MTNAVTAAIRSRLVMLALQEGSSMARARAGWRHDTRSSALSSQLSALGARRSAFGPQLVAARGSALWKAES
jgi:hypothetical protein